MDAWLTLQQALAAPGLRLAPVRAGLPSPWSEFARSWSHVKRIPSSLVDARDADRGLTSIRPLTGQESLPVVFWNDERPRSSWLRQVMMIARLLTEPAFGERERGIGHYLSKKYRHNTDSVEGSIKHCEEIVLTFGDLRSAGHHYLLGVWAAGNLARPVEGDWHRRRSAWGIISGDRQKGGKFLVSHPGNHSSRCIRFRFIAAHIRRHSAFTAHNPRRLKDLNPSTCLIQPNTGSGMVLRRR